MKKIHLLSLILGSIILLSSCSDDNINEVTDKKTFIMPTKAYLIAEQSLNSIIIRDAETQKNVWSWNPISAAIPYAHQSWFNGPSEAKPVYNNNYILMTASGGGVALIRISDHKLMFYANCGQNPHSAELLPDGNIVTAESHSGEINTFIVDTVRVLGVKSNTIKLGNAHNVVWDNKNNCIYATATIQSGVSALFKFKYNGIYNNPQLTNQQRIYTFDKESGGHDLFPVYGEDNKLWFTAASAVYKFNISKDPIECEKVYDITDVKSIDNGPDGIIMLKPTEEWWADGLINENSNYCFHMKDAKIYKGRWIKNNRFSYPDQHDLVLPE